MRLINLVNFRKDGAGIDIGSNNDFTCYFNQPITIQPNSKVVLLHAEINNTTAKVDTAISKELVFINIPSLPVVTHTGQSNGGKGRENHIVGAARTNDTDAISSTFIEVDLNNREPLIVTQLQVQILDTDYDLKVFGAGSFRQSVLLGIKECNCDMRKI